MDVSDLITVFDLCFRDSFQTELLGGAEEPLYQPRSDTRHMHQIWFRQDYIASALHEAAHWCVAGQQRRQLTDYGYWYAPDGRSNEQQKAFEHAEVKPQAMEWIFSFCAAVPFRVSADNLVSGAEPTELFKQRIVEQARCYVTQGLPTRARIFCQALAHHNNRTVPAAEVFCINDIA